nr:hypothetical protein [Tanacetum cinerariifolium]
MAKRSTVSWACDKRFIENFYTIAKSLTILTQKCKTFDWGKEHEMAFQILKEKLYNALVLALPDGPEFCDANVIDDALSRKERLKPKRVRAMNMTLQSSIKDKILAAQKEVVDEYAGSQKGLDEKIKHRSDGTLYYLDRIWVPLKGDSMQEALGTRLDMSTAYHPQTNGQSERTIKTLEDMLKVCVLDFGGSWDVHLSLVEFLYNNTYHSSVRCAPVEALYDRKCHSPIMWAEKSYADKRRKPLEFSVGDYFLLAALEKCGPVACQLDFPEELNGVHDTLYVSNLKKCLVDPTLQAPLDEIQVDAKLNFVEEHVEGLE